MSAVRASQQASSPRGGGGGGSYDLIVDVGDNIPIRVYWPTIDGADQFPVYNMSHYLPWIKGREAFANCAMYLDEVGAARLMEGHAGCVYHRLPSDNGGNTDLNANFWVCDMRKIHKMENEVSCIDPRTGNRFNSKYPKCDGQNCQWCRTGSQPQVGGWRRYRISSRLAEQWLAERPAIRQFCRTCGGVNAESQGTLSVYGYLCPSCNVQIGGPAAGQSKVVCTSCMQEVTPTEWLACETPNCPAPVRCDMDCFIWDIRCVGGGQSKNGKQKKIVSMSARTARICPPTQEEIEAAEKYLPNWDEAIAPEAAEYMLLKLKPELAAPIRASMGDKLGPAAGHGAVRYEDTDTAMEVAAITGQGATSGRFSVTEPNQSNQTGFSPPKPRLPPRPVQVQMLGAQEQAEESPLAPAPLQRAFGQGLRQAITNPAQPTATVGPARRLLVRRP